jgi:hypothetical protein
MDMEFVVMLLAGFHWEINPMDGHRISVMLLAGFHRNINSMARHGIFSNPTGWISLVNKFHAWTWIF